MRELDTGEGNFRASEGLESQHGCAATFGRPIQVARSATYGHVCFVHTPGGIHGPCVSRPALVEVVSIRQLSQPAPHPCWTGRRERLGGMLSYYHREAA